MKGLVSTSMYVRLAETMKLETPRLMGPSRVRRELMSPMPPEPLNSLRLPSRSPKSNTLDTRPPNRAGMLPL